MIAGAPSHVPVLIVLMRGSRGPGEEETSGSLLSEGAVL